MTAKLEGSHRPDSSCATIVRNRDDLNNPCSLVSRMPASDNSSDMASPNGKQLLCETIDALGNNTRCHFSLHAIGVEALSDGSGGVDTPRHGSDRDPRLARASDPTRAIQLTHALHTVF
jgi:hypothetical protein